MHQTPNRSIIGQSVGRQSGDERDDLDLIQTLARVEKQHDPTRKIIQLV